MDQARANASLLAKNKMVLEFGTSGTAVCAATFATNPIDVVKVRVQLANSTGVTPGLVGTASSILRNEGLSALFKGVSPAMARGLVYGGLRIGLYSPIKTWMAGDGKKVSMQTKLVAGCASGALAAGITNPIELVKTRLQAADCAPNANPMTVARDIMRSDGVMGLWRGTNPAAARAALLTASQCVTYDVVKNNIRYYSGADDNLPVQIATGAITGVVTTTVTAPADVLKTRMFAGGSGGVVDAATKLVAEEGFSALFKGWMANYVRLGPQTMIIFLVSEQLRKAFGLSAL